jgi:hypothetical protein
MRTHPLAVAQASQLVDQMTGETLHAKRILSLTNAVVGVIHAVSASIHAIGIGLAVACGLHPKHAIKQVDRLLSNTGLNVWELFEQWVPHVLAGQRDIVVALDWTEFDADGHATIGLYLVTHQGRATPLIWRTVPKRALKGRRNAYEDSVLLRLQEVLPPEIKVTVLADRGFGDHKLYEVLTSLGFDFIIRFRGNVTVHSASGEIRTATEWVPPNGQIRQLRGAAVTDHRHALDSVVCVKARGMKQPWCLAVRGPLAGAAAVKLYARRFTIEEAFRDTKDARYGLGLSATHIGDPRRRDRLLFICAMAMTLLTLLGAAGESLGMDRMLKANTVKRRTHSLFRQGCHYYAAIPMMPPERLQPLIQRFGEYILRQPIYVRALGLNMA